MGFCLFRVFIQLFTTKIGQRKAEFLRNHPLDLGKQLPDQNDGEVMHRTTTYLYLLPFEMEFSFPLLAPVSPLCLGHV